MSLIRRLLDSLTAIELLQKTVSVSSIPYDYPDHNLSFLVNRMAEKPNSPDFLETQGALSSLIDPLSKR
jgi:hypothetical protein